MEGEQVLARVVEYVFSPMYQLAVVVATLYFLYGMFMFIWQMKNPDSGDSEDKNNGKRHMLWGLVGLFIILSVGGILKMFNTVFEGVFLF